LRGYSPLDLRVNSFPPAVPWLTRFSKGMTRMESKSLIRKLALYASLAVALPLMAKPMTQSLPINHTVHIGSSSVTAGDYRLSIDGNHLTIMHGRKTVAESEGRWEDRDKKSEFTEILSDSNGKVLELRFAGKKSVFVLAQ
jgi:hypothetical protein